jgi:hypothetical protein
MLVIHLGAKHADIFFDRSYGAYCGVRLTRNIMVQTTNQLTIAKSLALVSLILVFWYEGRGHKSG